MARQEKKSYDLTAAELRELMTLIRQGKALPEKYRFILFEDGREIELVWNGKTRDVCTAVLPLRTLEHVGGPRTETEAQKDLFGGRGPPLHGWTNKLIWGDNKLILSSLKAGALRGWIEDAGGLKLIYIDPPFDVGADFGMDVEIGGRTLHEEPNLLEQIAYRDTWGRAGDSFIAMIYERLILMRDLMAEDASIYVHCDWRVTAHVRLLLDEVFGAKSFRNEIIWQGAVGDTSAKNTKFIKSHDTILFYGKHCERNCWNDVFQAYGDASESLYRFADEKGRYRMAPVDNPGGRGYFYDLGKGEKPPQNGYRMPKETALEWLAQGILEIRPGKVPGRKLYMGEGVRCRDVWDDIPSLQGSESLGYATQKPKPLVERIIRASSKEGDLVADFFCGSGTTAAVAEKLGRKWIATDLGKFAIHTTRKRLIGVQREMKAEEKDFRAFEVLNLGRYERQAYLDPGGRLHAGRKARGLVQKEAEFRTLVLCAYKATSLGGGGGTRAEDGFFHGARNGRFVAVGPIDRPVGRPFVDGVVTECRRRGASRADILAFEFEMSLFPAVLDEARGKGIDLAPKYIPAEIFDKRAVEKGQVPFHDVGFVEAAPRYGGKNRRAVKIELTGFSVYPTQGAAEAAEAAIFGLKEGKSEFVCARGQLYKVRRSKGGVVEKEKLTKHWTDWVDYWAVDFDYMTRKEIIEIPKGSGEPGGNASAPGFELPQGELAVHEFEERWTGGYVFDSEWQSFRTRRNRELELTTAEHAYDRPGRYKAAVKVIDVFGNDAMTLVPVDVG